MQIFGFTIARTKALRTLSSVPGSRGWWPLIQELTTGAWQRNEDVSIDTALSNPTLYACVSLIAEDISKLRPKLVEQDADGIWHEVDSSAFSPVLRKPNHYQGRIKFFEWWMISKLVHGNTYAIKARDGRGVVRALYILDPIRVKPLVASDGSVFYQLSPSELASIEDSVVVPAREIIHDVMCPLFHELVGVSPIYAAGFPAIQGLNIRRGSDKFFSNGSKPGGVLTAPGHISQDTADRLKTYWESNFSGENVGKIAVLGDGLKYEAMAMSAEQSQLVAQLQMTDEDIAKCFHMPRHKVGIGPDPSYNNVEALTKTYYSDCLQSLLEQLEDVLDFGLELVDVPGKTLGIEFDRDALFEMDTAAKSAAATAAVGAGVMSPNEARHRYYDLGPVTGGETPYLQQQNYSLAALDRRDQTETPGQQAQAQPPQLQAPADTMPPATPAQRGIDPAEYDRAVDIHRKELAA